MTAPRIADFRKAPRVPERNLPMGQLIPPKNYVSGEPITFPGVQVGLGSS